MAEPDWATFEGNLERLPRLNDEMKKAGTEAVVVFQDNGRVIPADVMQAALKAKGLKIKARDTTVFTLLHGNERKSLLVGNTSYTNFRELAAIRRANKDTLVGAKVKISRIAENDPTTSNYRFEAA